MTIQPVTRCALAIMTAAAVALISGCGAAQAPASTTPAAGVTSLAGATPESGPAVTPTATPSPTATTSPGVMSATQACRFVTGQERRGFFVHIEQVHLVLTTYAKGEPIEAHGDISGGMAPSTLVWVVEVHAQAINWDHSRPAVVPAPATPQAVPVDTDFSTVIDARTGQGSDAGECRCWPLPLQQAGPLISLPAGC